MVTPLDEFMAKKANDYMAVVDTWLPQTRQFKEIYDEYKRWVGAPDGTEWTGRTSNAAYDTASTDCHGSDNTHDTAEDGGKLVAATIQYEVVDPLVNGQRLIESVLAHKDQGVSIAQDYKMDYHPAEGESDDSIARNRAHVADIQRQIEEYVAKWEKGCQTLKTQADATAQTITGCINPKTALVDGRKALRDAATPKPGDPSAQPANFYKDWYPKATDPASIDPGAGTLGDKLEHIKNPATTPTAATAAADPNAPQYGPFAKDTIDKTKVGGLGESVTYLNRNDKPPEEHKPSAAERFKTDISEGIDKGVDKLVAPFTDLRDRLGLGDKGFWEANEEAGRREWESFKHHMTTPPGADIAEGIKHNIENPGQYFGEKLVDGGALMAGGPEGLLPRAGLEEAAAARLGAHPDLPSPGALHDTPAPAAHTADPSDATHPAPVVDHPPPTVADHSPPPTQHQLPTPDQFDPSVGQHYTSGDPHHPGGWPPHTPEATWTKGDPTPGWEHVNRGPDKPWMGFQEQITGIERTPDGRIPEYVMTNPETGEVVRFDSGPIERGNQQVFLDAKHNYTPLIKSPDAPWTENIQNELVREAQRQIRVLPPETGLEWHVANPQSAAIIRNLLEGRGLDVDVIYTPEKP
ncbi:Uncharacterised protein [Mycobacteroides abscessus subsp. massiliense]|nr:Uncharacterised protein [Mycobacteroides abscessus subsp. massiliense]SLH53062.1 Uncharacterised protein [Mycobacteroides abscessus subsp. massiliense]